MSKLHKMMMTLYGVFLQLVPTDGLIRRHAHLKTGRYHQHLKDHLDLDMSALDYMMKCYPEEKELEQMRRSLGRYGLTGKQQVTHSTSITTLSTHSLHRCVQCVISLMVSDVV